MDSSGQAITQNQAKIHSILIAGSSGVMVDIECHLSNNLPNITIIGLANRAVDEARERIRGAFSTSRIALPRKRITINLAPADMPKTDSSLDLAIATAIIYSDSSLMVKHSSLDQSVFIGELGLDGSVKAVRGIIGKIMSGRNIGIDTFFIPEANMNQAQLVPDVRLIAIKNLRQLFDHLTGLEPLTITDTVLGKLPKAILAKGDKSVSLDEIVGQARAKRALQIAAAGGHNILLSGPPGTGKSLLAHALPTLLPAPTHEEILEITQLHSLYGQKYDQIMTDRPFRSPHHTASTSAIIGGGASLRPGEISLAHGGVLLLDEFPEFHRDVREALRQPLEDHTINITRLNATAEYLADFILVATANPCPCGYLGSARCQCTPAMITSYQSKLSGPIIDRIDIFTEVSEVEHGSLLSTSNGNEQQEAAWQVGKARKMAHERLGDNRLNNSMTNTELATLGRLAPKSKQLIDAASAKLGLSARGYIRAVRVARTIADLDGSDMVTSEHISEALSYRQPQKPL